jgi:hypothetical protein
VLAALFSDRRVFNRPMAIAEVVLTLPHVAVGAAGLITEPADRAG